MSQQDFDKISETFLDVAPYFSEEEWKLLHKWQKELYKNVMKEIHQAFISLGPLIATTVISLKAKEKEDTFPMKNQDFERRNIHNLFPSDTSADPDLFRINREEAPDLKYHQNSERGDSSECLSTDVPFLNTDISLRKEEEAVPIFIDHLGVEVRESSTDPNTGHEIVSFCLKEEEAAYCMDHHDDEGIVTISSSTGDGSVNRKQKVGDSVKHSRKETSSIKAKVKMVDSYEKETPSRNQLWLGNNHQLGGEEITQCETGFNDQALVNFYQGTPKVQRSETDNDWGSDLCTATPLSCQSNIQQTVSRYSCTECEKTFSKKEYLIGHKKTHMGVRPYQCTECEKSFSRKYVLVEHKRTHTGERPYHCTICEKSFSQNGVLNRHLRTHMHVKM